MYIEKYKNQNYQRQCALTPEYIKFGEDFENVLTAEHAYLLGFLWVDGHINKDRPRISCGIAKSDALILEKIFTKTGKWNQSDYIPKNPRYQIITNFKIGNFILHDFLKTNDYMAKSWLSADKILSKIPENLCHYWFRGLIDGDGNIHQRSIRINSGKEQDWTFMVNICKKLNIEYKINKKIFKNNHGGSEFEINKYNGFIKFGVFIYNNFYTDQIGLHRKFNKWIERKEYYLKYNFDILQIDPLSNKIINTFETINDASIKTATSKGRIYHSLSKKVPCAGFKWEYRNKIINI